MLDGGKETSTGTGWPGRAWVHREAPDIRRVARPWTVIERFTCNNLQGDRTGNPALAVHPDCWATNQVCTCSGCSDAVEHTFNVEGAQMIHLMEGLLSCRRDPAPDSARSASRNATGPAAGRQGGRAQLRMLTAWGQTNPRNELDAALIPLRPATNSLRSAAVRHPRLASPGRHVCIALTQVQSQPL